MLHKENQTLQAKALTNAILVGGRRDKRDTRCRQSAAEAAEHRAVVDRFRSWRRGIWVAHNRPIDRAAFDNHLGFCAKEGWFPQHHVRELP